MKKCGLVVLPIFLTAGQFALIPLHDNSLNIAIGAVVTVIETAYLSTMCFFCRREEGCTCNDKYWTVLVATAAGCDVLSALILFISATGTLYSNN